MMDFINNITTQDNYILIAYMGLPVIFSLTTYFVTLPLLKGRKALIVVWLSYFFLLVYMLVLIMTIYSLSFHAKLQSLPVFLAILIVSFIFASTSLKNKIIYAWLNDDNKYKALMTPIDGRDICVDHQHPFRLKIEAAWIATYFLSFFIGIIFSVISGLFNFSYNAAIVILSAGGFMGIAHIGLEFIEKCPRCHFAFFPITKDNKTFMKMIKLAFRILFKKSFNCINCGAHFTVGKSSKSQLPEVK